MNKNLKEISLCLRKCQNRSALVSLLYEGGLCVPDLFSQNSGTLTTESKISLRGKKINLKGISWLSFRVFPHLPALHASFTDGYVECADRDRVCRVRRMVYICPEAFHLKYIRTVTEA